jgi:hypothetical protein
MKTHFKLLLLAVTLAAPPKMAGASEIPAAPQSWEDVYNPHVLRSFHVQLTEADYLTIRHDETFDIEVPALFWLEGELTTTSTGEEVPLVSEIFIRRKSATAIGDKISYRIKFQNRWHDLKSLSLENGDDNNVVSEGLSWHLHRLASTPDYEPGLAAWNTLTLHIERPATEEGDAFVETLPQGVYLNVELPDKWFLAHRGLWDKPSTWLYKQDDIGLPELKETPTGFDSYTYVGLDYSPFQATRRSGKRIINPTPSDRVLEQDLKALINMESLLRVGAVNAFTDNPDELFNKGKNFFWADFTNLKREYTPWDLDATIRSTTAGIYGTLSSTSGKGGKTTVSVTQHPFQSVILNHPTFRKDYNSIMTSLINGPMHPNQVAADLTQFEALLSDALAADPNNQIGDASKIAAHFEFLRQWVRARAANVAKQVSSNNMPVPRSY